MMDISNTYQSAKFTVKLSEVYQMRIEIDNTSLPMRTVVMFFTDLKDDPDFQYLKRAIEKMKEYHKILNIPEAIFLYETMMDELCPLIQMARKDGGHLSEFKNIYPAPAGSGALFVSYEDKNRSSQYSCPKICVRLEFDNLF